MKRLRSGWLFGTAFVLWGGQIVRAADTPAGAALPQPAVAHAASVYRPPIRPMLAGRVGGASRGGAGQDLGLVVVAPQDHAGETTRDQPTLYWASTKAIAVPVEIVVTNDAAIDPLFTVRLSPPVAAGLHSVRLRGSALHLAPGQLYQLTVSAVYDETARSKDASSSGFIVRRPGETDGSLTATDLAQAGLWYDAFDMAASGDASLRNVLLTDVGLAPIGGAVADP